jgi:signal transduction histidine kinase/ligand-binding sensor domain-containing protein
LFLGAVSSACALDPNNHISQYGHTAWRIQDGVFNGTPHTIAQTADGYVWIGTEQGLVRFDGVRFVPWSEPQGKHLPRPNVYSLLGSHDGSLWIGSGDGLAHWTNGDLVNYPETFGRTNAIVEDQQGTVWAVRSRNGGNGALCEVARGKARCYNAADGLNCPYGSSLGLDREGNVWVGSTDALCRWKEGSFETYLQKELKETEALTGVLGIAAGKDGSLWAGIGRPGKNLGLRQLVEGIWRTYSVPGMDGASLAVNKLLLDRSNALWIGTVNQGIYRVHGGKADHFGSADGLSSDSIENLFEDREGNMWVATSKGIDCFRDVRVATFSVREGLSADAVASVLATQDGSIWIGNEGALDVLRKGAPSRITAREGLPGKDVTSLFQDHAGNIWVGVDQDLAVFDQHRFRLVKRPDGSGTGVVVALTEDRDHNIWAAVVGKRAGLIRIRNMKAEEIMPDSAVALAPDPEGGVWIGFAKAALARYRDGRLDKFSPNHDHRPLRVTGFQLDPDGTVWGASSQGLLRWKAGTIESLNTRNGLPCDSVYAVLRDNSNSLWLSTSCGFVAIPDSELQNWAQQPAGTVKVRTLDNFDGARPAEAPFKPMASKSPDGRLWFANESFLQMIDPSHLELNDQLPPIHIEEIVADRKSYIPQEKMLLPARTRDLEIDYTALSFRVPQKIRFRYKLEGRDSDWQDPQARRQAFYSDLGPGNYRFRVIACNNDGVWNEAGATLEFRVAPAWYQTIWFRISCVGAFGLLLWALYRLRLQQLERQFNIRLEERVGERIRIARELHDTLLQSFHALLLHLQAASHLLLTRPEEAKQRLDSSIDQADQAIAEGIDAVRDLRSSTIETNNLTGVIRAAGEELSAAQSSQNAAVCRVEAEGTPRNLRPIVRDEVYRIAVEALRNAFRHAQARQIEVDLRYDETQFQLSIRDDGKGVDPKILGGEGRAGHFGLPGMRERANRIGGKLTIRSEPNSGTPNSGTEVQLNIHATKAYAISPTALRFWLPKNLMKRLTREEPEGKEPDAKRRKFHAD